MQTYNDIIQCGHKETRELLADWSKDNHPIGGVIKVKND